MADPLCRDVAWSRTVRLPILGVPTTFATNSDAVLGAIEETYGHWAPFTPPAGCVCDKTPTIRIAVHDHLQAPDPAPAFSYRLPDPTRLFIAWNGGVGVADTLRLESVAYATEELVSRRLEFVEAVLEPLTLFLLGALDREPLHATAVFRDGAAILLAGPSGAGKSTLTYAAWRHGFSFLAEEPVYVQMRPALRVWGRRPRLHLPLEARAHFPELRDVPALRLPSGKTKMVVRLTSRIQPYADRAGICLLPPGSRETSPTLERIPAEEVLAELGRDLESGFDLFAGTIHERLAAIAAAGAWRLHVGRSPADALPLLERIAAELAGPA
jgi:hypothetical protein